MSDVCSTLCMKTLTYLSPRYKLLLTFLSSISLLALSSAGFDRSNSGHLPKPIRNIMQKPRYSEAIWALRVVDVNSGEIIYNLNSEHKLLTGSVRKLYSVGVALNELGTDYPVQNTSFSERKSRWFRKSER